MICKGTKKVKGCGKDKPETEFYKTKAWRNRVCCECRNKDKREKYAKAKIVDNIMTMAWR